MWAHPKTTLRKLVQQRKGLHLFLLSALYVLQESLYSAHFWSMGYRKAPWAIVGMFLLLAYPLGIVWLYLRTAVFYWVGRGFSGKASFQELRVLVAWTQVPMIASLLLWLVVLLAYPGEAFWLHTQGVESLFLLLVLAILSVWSFVLQVAGSQELHHFSGKKALGYVVTCCIIMQVASFITFMCFRSFYLQF